MKYLRKQLAQAKRHSADGKKSLAHQRALIIDLEKTGRDTSLAEDVLRTMIEAQQLHEDAERRLIEEMKSLAPEEWRVKYAEKLKAPQANRETNSSIPCLYPISLSCSPSLSVSV